MSGLEQATPSQTRNQMIVARRDTATARRDLKSKSIEALSLTLVCLGRERTLSNVLVPQSTTVYCHIASY